MLDRYGVKPIVGVIPDCQDELFVWEEDPNFWTDTVQRWKDKQWTIAQHGYHHVYHDCGQGKHSEYIGLNYAAQRKLIDDGYCALVAHDCKPSCFFAPGHSFDEITVAACRDSGYFDFISDGYALYPYIEQDMLFFPSIFDTAHKMLPFGIYTFIIHPSFTSEAEINYLSKFIEKNQKLFVPVPEILKEVNQNRKRTVLEKMIQPSITAIRRMRKIVKKV